jgi:thymidylate synthase (FAD)
MKIVQPSISFRWITPDPLKQIETATRLCYKSEDKIGEGSDIKMAKKLLARKHYAMFDHASMSYHVICDRGVTHEFVRHRLFGFAQESTRYCNYSLGKFTGGIQIIMPECLTVAQYSRRFQHFLATQELYETEIAEGQSPQIARGVLPTCLKTELIVTGDFTEWRHFFKLRTAPDAHPQMREIAIMILNDATMRVPVVFDEFL